MVVILHAEPAPDPISNHRPRPHPRREANSLGAGLDVLDQFAALDLAEARDSARSLSGFETLGAVGLEPLQPAIDRPSGDVQVGAQRNYAPAVDVSEDCFGAPPRRQIPDRLGFHLQPLQLRQLARGTSGDADRFPLLRARHDLLQGKRDRATMILAHSFVNFLDPFPGDPV